MRISDWSSDVCSSDLLSAFDLVSHNGFDPFAVDAESNRAIGLAKIDGRDAVVAVRLDGTGKGQTLFRHPHADVDGLVRVGRDQRVIRSEEHTSELQSLMRNSYAFFCLKKKTSRYNT